MKIMEIGVDLRTNQLIACARAAQMAGDLPKDSAGKLVALARAVRLYAEAGQRTLSLARLDDLDKFVRTSEDALLVKAVTGISAELRKYHKP